MRSYQQIFIAFKEGMEKRSTNLSHVNFPPFIIGRKIHHVVQVSIISLSPCFALEKAAALLLATVSSQIFLNNQLEIDLKNPESFQQ